MLFAFTRNDIKLQSYYSFCLLQVLVIIKNEGYVCLFRLIQQQIRGAILSNRSKMCDSNLQIFFCKNSIQFSIYNFLTVSYFYVRKLEKIRYTAVHRGAFCQFHFWWIYYYGSNKSTGKKNWQNTPLCSGDILRTRVNCEQICAQE